jgi:hypothetical protein
VILIFSHTPFRKPLQDGRVGVESQVCAVHWHGKWLVRSVPSGRIPFHSSAKRGVISTRPLTRILVQGGIASAMIFGCTNDPSLPNPVPRQHYRWHQRMADPTSHLQAWGQRMAPQNPALALEAWEPSGRT